MTLQMLLALSPSDLSPAFVLHLKHWTIFFHKSQACRYNTASIT